MKVLRDSRMDPGWTAAIAALLFGAACDRPATTAGLERPEPALHGAALVVGSTVDQWSILTVPQEGGLADARDLADLDRVLWTGRTELPASIEAHALSGGRILLRSADGSVHTYDPSTDALVRVGEVEPEAVWVGDRTSGVYWSPEGTILEISPQGVWRYGLEESLLWAAPADGGVLAMLDSGAGARTIWLLKRDESEPAETGPAPGVAPGLVMAWGRRAAFRTADGRGLVFMTVEPIEVAAETDLPGPLLALSSSPSSHEVYVTVDDPPRLMAINRFNLERRVLADIPGPASAIRPTLFGEGVLVRQEGSALRVPAGGGPPVRLESEWRSDLPLGLPESRVATLEGDRVRVADLASGAAAEVDGVASERWWIPSHWNPASSVTTDRLAAEAVPGTPPAGEPSAVDSAVPARVAEAAPGLRDELPPPVASGPPPGFYAIVGSARRAEGIRSLVQSLEEAGFATQVQDVPDEAGRTWFRGLVGPYPSRSEAEAAARQLLRERRLEAWVTEIAASGRAREETN